MLLYVVVDSKAKTISLPQLSADEATVKEALKELNPENLDDLLIVPLCEIDHPRDLLRLRLDDAYVYPLALSEVFDETI